MDLMIHSSSFLLPSTSAGDDHRRSLTYALVLLNQRLPKFTPLLWEHEQHKFEFAPMEEPIGSMTICLFSSQTKTPPMFAAGIRIVAFKALQQRRGISICFNAYCICLLRENLWFKPDVIKGDMDSVRSEVLNFYSDLGTDVVDESDDQDTTDLHKCIAYINGVMPNLDKSSFCILVTGALGGRFDHEAGNINVLHRFSTTRITLLSDDCLIYLLPKTHRHEIHVNFSAEGPHCGLVPMGMPSRRTTTTGLQWDLNDAEMRFGGLVSTSNIVKAEKVTVESDADLLWTISIKKF
ncbi:unnamed protein product [Linum tenue]|uniref:thiamine diphosphokinase n=1 Tax=Linum tenue TaxID=586396 RepID=A0AAV0NNR3_9ROSI|nr:unnamed protein product [Linum tenue]